jgi:hypothetical protein
MDPCSVAISYSTDYSISTNLNRDRFTIVTNFLDVDEDLIRSLTMSLANADGKYFYQRRINRTDLKVIMNNDKFFSYQHMSVDVLIQTLLQIYYYRSGDISKSKLFNTFNQLDKMISSNFKTFDFDLKTINFNIDFTIDNGKNIRNLTDKLVYIKLFGSKPRNILNFRDVEMIYKNDNDKYEMEDLRSLAHDLHNFFDDPNNEPLSREDIENLADNLNLHDILAEDLNDEIDYSKPTTSKNANKRSKKTKKRGSGHLFIKKTIVNFKKTNKNTKHLSYLKSLIKEILN